MLYQLVRFWGFFSVVPWREMGIIPPKPFCDELSTTSFASDKNDCKKTSPKVGVSALVYELPAVALEILLPLILSINFIFTNILYPCQNSIYILPSTVLLHCYFIYLLPCGVC